MLSQKARYALRALLYIAARSGPVSIGEIAEEEGISRKFLELILADLRPTGLVVSRRGKTGGYQLARPPNKITFAEIIRAIDGPLALAPCASRTAFRPCEGCVDPKICPIRKVLLEARDATAKVLESKTLSSAEGARKLLS